MKTLATIAKENGHTLTIKEGGNHTKVSFGEWKQVIPRHNEISEKLARAIIRSAQQ